MERTKKKYLNIADGSQTTIILSKKAYKTYKFVGLKKKRVFKIFFPDLRLLHGINTFIHVQHVIFPLNLIPIGMQKVEMFAWVHH